MAKQVIVTRHQPKYHYSLGIKAGQFIFLAGVSGTKNPDTGEDIKGIEAQTKQCLNIIKDNLNAGGASLDDVVSATVYLKNADDIIKMNEAYKTYFPKDPPVRTTVITGLVNPSALVAIQCIAYCPGK